MDVPHHKSAKKRVRQTEKKTELNKSLKSRTKSAVKAVRLAIAENKKDDAEKSITLVQKYLARLAKKGIIKKNAAARQTSRLTSQVSKL
ncbi:MAG: 30S ribosomal protein S20 [Deltaproteobacteria bacterium]|nr:MAG: 30S ribosomal protein S20 [Deltaproteobacteria bacterium]TNF30385.1 MAG: 30S ribosomal protein S20 [Deltaproteobacteria bacterium]